MFNKKLLSILVVASSLSVSSFSAFSNPIGTDSDLKIQSNNQIQAIQQNTQSSSSSNLSPNNFYISNSISSGNHEYLVYKGSKKYYALSTGQTFQDKRRTGAIYPNLFDLVRVGNNGEYIKNEEQSCDLQEMFRGTIYKKFGFDARRYLNALATSSDKCASLPSFEEQSLCKQYHEESGCAGATPIVFQVLPLSPGESYLTKNKENNTCQIASQSLLQDRYIPKQSKEWSKIQGDLLDKKRAKATESFRASAPIESLRADLISKKGQANKRDLDFAINEWAYNKAKEMTFQIDEQEIKSIVEERYSPSSAVNNLLSSSGELKAALKARNNRYESKVYAEATNIPPHSILLFNDFVNPQNGCLIK
ncbi:MAG: hypothetical protein ACK481_09700 [Candidatus Melainabacteria bacterium]|jgi:hypothetical protein